MKSFWIISNITLNLVRKPIRHIKYNNQTQNTSRYFQYNFCEESINVIRCIIINGKLGKTRLLFIGDPIVQQAIKKLIKLWLNARHCIRCVRNQGKPNNQSGVTSARRFEHAYWQLNWIPVELHLFSKPHVGTSFGLNELKMVIKYNNKLMLNNGTIEPFTTSLYM